MSAHDTLHLKECNDAQQFLSTESDQRFDVVQTLFFEFIQTVTTVFFPDLLFFESTKTVMEINLLRGNLCTVTDIVFFLNPYFFTNQRPTRRRQH